MATAKSVHEPARFVGVVHELPRGAASPVVFDVPHAGRVYPEDFRAVAPIELLRTGEDRFVDQLVADAPDSGAHLIVAEFARTYIDPNRSEADIDAASLSEPWLEPIEMGKHASVGAGLVFRMIGSEGRAIYDRLLSRSEVQFRIERYHRPYHARLKHALESVRNAFGLAFHISAHSMLSVGNERAPDAGRTRADFVLGDRDATSCMPALTDFVEAQLGQLGYSVARNDPYKGAELVARYGRPDAGVHSLQIEIKRSLYIDEQTLEKHDGFERLRRDLQSLIERLCAWATEQALRRPTAHASP